MHVLVSARAEMFTVAKFETNVDNFERFQLTVFLNRNHTDSCVHCGKKFSTYIELSIPQCAVCTSKIRVSPLLAVRREEESHLCTQYQKLNKFNMYAAVLVL